MRTLIAGGIHRGLAIALYSDPDGYTRLFVSRYDAPFCSCYSWRFGRDDMPSGWQTRAAYRFLLGLAN